MAWNGAGGLRTTHARAIGRCGTASTSLINSIDQGTSAAADGRQMRQGSFTFRYNLYLEASGTLIFGDGTRGTSLYANPVPPAKTLVTVMMYGRIPAHQYAERIGAYADTLTVQIQF